MKTRNRELGLGESTTSRPRGRVTRVFSLLLLVGALFSGALPATAQLGMLLHPTNTLWSFWTNGTNPGYGLAPGSPAWAQPTFDDTAWPKGRGLFGNDSGYPYPFQTVTPPPSVAVRFYARTHFNWNGNIHGVTLRGTNFVDDGAVVYLNGVEIYRINMPAGPTSFETLAPGTLAEPVRVPLLLSLDALTNGNANPLVAGDNVIAVETASNTPFSADTVWGLSLYAGSDPCLPLGLIRPNQTNVLECASVTFAVTFEFGCLGPRTYQWFRDRGAGEEMIIGATESALTLTNISRTDAGQYYLRTTAGAGTVDSARAVLAVTPDTAGPVILSAEVEDDGYGIRITFDEAYLPARSGGAGDAVDTWRVRSIGGEQVAVTSAFSEPARPRQVRLTLGNPLTPGVAYEYETTRPIADACLGLSAPAGQRGLVLYRVNVIHWTDGRDWRFNMSGNTLGIEWRQVGYDDSSWEIGPQGFGNEPNGFPDAPDSQRTQWRMLAPNYVSYFRTRFTVPSGASNLLFRAAVDDGAVVYVNGTEIGRINAPVEMPGPVFPIEEGQGYLPAEGIPIPSQVLRAGENILAIELRQATLFDADALLICWLTASLPGHEDELEILTQPQSVSLAEGQTFTLAVTTTSTRALFQWLKDGVEIPGATASTYTKVADVSSAGVYRVVVSTTSSSLVSEPATVIVRRQIKAYASQWKYQIQPQDSTLEGVAWYAVGFDDSAWPSAPGPFGVETTASTLARIPAITTPLPAPSPSQLTVYFRSTVNVPALAADESLYLSHVIDDGAAFYVDGNFAFAYNLDARLPIRSATLTPGAPSVDGDARELIVPVTLAPGEHLLAAEVHQAGATSSDVVFGAELTRGPKLPRLNIQYTGPTTVLVTWTPAVGVHLYSAPSAAGNFTLVSGKPQGSLSSNLAVDGRVRFFRLGY